VIKIRTKDKHNKGFLTELHCIGCGRFLGYECVVVGVIKIKCKSCKEWTVIESLYDEEELQKGT